MNNDLIKNIEQIVETACKQDTNYFGYEIWTYHIKNVVKNASMLAKKIGADEEIVIIAALLHDYAGIVDYRMRSDHHIYGAVKAEKILKQYNYPQEKIEQVKHCIISHRGSKYIPRQSKEAICVADADAMAHFDAIPALLHLAFFKHKMTIDKAIEWLNKKLKRSWQKLSPLGQEIVAAKYEACHILLEKERAI